MKRVKKEKGRERQKGGQKKTENREERDAGPRMATKGKHFVQLQVILNNPNYIKSHPLLRNLKLQQTALLLPPLFPLSFHSAINLNSHLSFLFLLYTMSSNHDLQLSWWQILLRIYGLELAFIFPPRLRTIQPRNY